MKKIILLAIFSALILGCASQPKEGDHKKEAERAFDELENN